MPSLALQFDLNDDHRVAKGTKYYAKYYILYSLPDRDFEVIYLAPVDIIVLDNKQAACKSKSSPIITD